MADGLAGETGPATFGILGCLEVSRSGRMVPLGGPRQRAVLALLLLEANQVVSMDRLAEDIWDGHPPAGWATTVQTYVFHLRRALEPDRARGAGGGVLVTRGRGYLLSVNREQLDAARFLDGFTVGRAALDAGRYAEAAEMLRQALALWRSGVLADLADYAFIRPEAARLDELRLAALEARIDADLALGRHDALTGELEHLAASHPLRERLHGQLMLALYRCGRQAEALAAYRRARDLLAAELGIDPGEPLQHLHQSVLAHDPALDWNQHRETVADDHLAHAHSPAPGRGPEGRDSRPAAASRVLGWGSGPARRVLVAGLALAVTAAAIVTVTRPWAGVPPGLPGNTVGLIDAGGGRVGAAVSLGSPAGLAYGDGSIWAVDGTEGTVSRINPVTHAVIEQIPVGSAPTAVTVTGGNVWVTNSGDGTVSRINAAADRIVGTTSVGNVPVAIASGPSGVWVANEGDDTVNRINPATGKVTGKVQVGGHPDGIAVGPDAVWVANGEDGTVTRIDLATGQPGGPVSVGSGPAGIAITPAAVWIANSLDLTVSKIDPATDSVTRTISVGDGPSGIVAARGALWVSDEFDATLDRIDQRSGQVTRSVFVGSSPQGLAATPSGVWVAARPFAAASHRGGTLTVASDGLPEREPMNGFDDVSQPALSTVYDGLVAQRRSGGAASITLVPDLARTLPRPAGGGTVYTFTLRRGIRYSNGVLVRASDFRRGIMRQLSFGDYPPYYEGILGGQACHQVPRRCDLSAGIITNDTAGTVTFHLDHADPDFLYKLALILAVPAPPGAPDHAMDRAPFLPGTGPYMISQYRPNVSFTLVRNPYFRQWSFAAQPAGYPSVIRYNHVASENEEDSAVIAGRADLTPVADNGQSLATRYPAQVHAGLKTATTYLFLNTRQPPFTSLKARQAVNYAIDRGRILQLLHRAPGQAAVTCQLLPADFPGHQPYCPYTTGTEDGSWHGPDMAKARQLAQESSTTNVPVTVWTFGDFGRSFANTAVNSYLVQLLNDLGYRARMRVVSAAQFFTTVSNAHSKIQAGLAGWGADFPTASGMIVPALSCGSFDQDPTNTTNYAGFCDPHADQLASQAQAAQLTDPATARTLWAQVDHIITDQAPWAPIISFATASFVSARIGNYQQSASLGPLLDEMWVR
jgi:YVTN family beta-propeller protein